jgi:hypothetical protein
MIHTITYYVIINSTSTQFNLLSPSLLPSFIFPPPRALLKSVPRDEANPAIKQPGLSLFNKTCLETRNTTELSSPWRKYPRMGSGIRIYFLGGIMALPSLAEIFALHGSRSLE